VVSPSVISPLIESSAVRLAGAARAPRSALPAAPGRTDHRGDLRYLVHLLCRAKPMGNKHQEPVRT
jgi:hypothetical protein